MLNMFHSKITYIPSSQITLQWNVVAYAFNYSTQEEVRWISEFEDNFAYTIEFQASLG